MDLGGFARVAAGRPDYAVDLRGGLARHRSMERCAAGQIFCTGSVLTPPANTSRSNAPMGIIAVSIWLPLYIRRPFWRWIS